MAKKIYFSKSYKNIFNIKQDFYNENYKYLKQAQKWNRLYSAQPKRKNCKTCKKKLGKVIFSSNFANYAICNYCNHLNGMNEDTKLFNTALYKNEKGNNLSQFYKKKYLQRISSIYIPKINFLRKVVKNKIDITEFGSGAGHFLYACEKLKIQGTGYEVNLNSVNLANKMLKNNKVHHIEIDDLYKKILKTETNVTVLLGTIEHLTSPNKVFENFKKSKSKYLFFSVPLLSFSVFLEHALQNIFPRLLGGVHNHLYSEKSLNYIIEKNKLKIIGEWWFGTDIASLFRALGLHSRPKNKILFDKYFEYYVNSVNDNLQTVLDRKKICDEVHMVLTK